VGAAAADTPGTPRAPSGGEAGLGEFATARAAWEASWKELIDKMNAEKKIWTDNRADYINKVIKVRQCFFITRGAKFECTWMLVGTITWSAAVKLSLNSTCATKPRRQKDGRQVGKSTPTK
jgi:hypothetical protein